MSNRPCDCKSAEDTARLESSSIQIGDYSLTVEPNRAVLRAGPGTLEIGMRTLKKLAEWYLREQPGQDEKAIGQCDMMWREWEDGDVDVADLDAMIGDDAFRSYRFIFRTNGQQAWLLANAEAREYSIKTEVNRVLSVSDWSLLTDKKRKSAYAKIAARLLATRHGNDAG